VIGAKGPDLVSDAPLSGSSPTCLLAREPGWPQRRGGARRGVARWRTGADGSGTRRESRASTDNQRIARGHDHYSSCAPDRRRDEQVRHHMWDSEVQERLAARWQGKNSVAHFTFRVR